MGDRFERILDMSAKSQLAQIASKTLNDFLYYTFSSPWVVAGVSSGSNGAQGADENHKGVFAFTSHASNADSGVRVTLGGDAMVIGGGEKTKIVFKTATTITGVTRRIGFHDTVTASAPVDGIYCRIVDGVITGCTSASSVASVTSSDFTLTADTWYRLEIEVSLDKSQAVFTLYQDLTDIVLWSDTLSENIPTGLLGHGDVCTLASPSGATLIGNLDYMEITFGDARRLL